MPWKKGQSGNPEGRKVEGKWREVLDRAIKQDDGKRLRAAAEKLLECAANGESWAVKELGDRLDGKSIQPIQGDVDTSITVKIVNY